MYICTLFEIRVREQSDFVCIQSLNVCMTELFLFMAALCNRAGHYIFAV